MLLSSLQPLLLLACSTFIASVSVYKFICYNMKMLVFFQNCWINEGEYKAVTNIVYKL